MTVEVIYFAGCPHAESARALVRRCVAGVGIDVAVIEREDDFPSPTVRVDGRDVMGDPPMSGRACRLDLPTEERVMAALRGGKTRWRCRVSRV